MNAILTLLYPALVKQSEFLLAKYPGHVLQPEDLLHTALERLLRRPPPERMHEALVLRGLVVTVMRRVLVDEWRRNSAARRHAGSTVPLAEAAHVAAEEPETWPEVNEALAALRSELSESADVVELRFFHGVPQCEIARSLAVSPATMSRRWQSAATWLRQALTSPASVELRAA